MKTREAQVNGISNICGYGQDIISIQHNVYLFLDKKIFYPSITEFLKIISMNTREAQVNGISNICGYGQDIILIQHYV